MQKCVYVQVTYKFNLNTGEVEAEDLECKTIFSYIASLKSAWYTQDPVSKLKAQQIKTPAINPNKLSSIIKS